MTAPVDRTDSLIARLDFYAAMIRSRLFSPAARDVAYMLLYQHLNGATGRCDPAIPTLAAETSLDERNIRRAIRELARSGWWTVESRGRGAGRGRTNSYRPNYEKANIGVPEKQDIPDLFSDGKQDIPDLFIDTADNHPIGAKQDITALFPGQKTGQFRPPNLKRKNIHTESAHSRLVCEGPFQEFWHLYPRRLGSNPKKPAQAEFERALQRGAKPAAILRGAANFAREIELIGTERRFVVQAVRWLKEERWQEYQEAPEPARQRLPGLL